MFKGSKKFPAKRGVSVLDMLTEKGALVNASTWCDRTDYHEVVPKKHALFALTLEADRMRNALITERDLREELPAVTSEYAMRVENEPSAYLEQSVWATAFMAHPYHHPTIGWKSDFENISLSRLRAFYDTYYHPNNAVLSVVGDIERDMLFCHITKTFGKHPRSPAPIPRPHTVEPEQCGARMVEVVRAGTVSLVTLAYKVPSALHVDTPALMVLARILAGGATSRLERALVEKGLCASVSVSGEPFRDPHLISFSLTPNAGVSLAKIERVFFAELEKVREKGVHDAEVARVARSVETQLAFEREGHYGLLSLLNEGIAHGAWDFYLSLPERVAEVTAPMVHAVAQKYLVKEGRTTGRYVGTESLSPFV
jgi:zinc protease